jgi:hypothetical protein
VSTIQPNSWRLLYTINVFPFDNRIKIAEKRRTVYYKIEDKDNLPKKYQTTDYGFDKEGYLVHIPGKSFVIKNSKSAGTPRYWNVNGQDIYNGYVNKHGRASRMRMMKEYLSKYISQSIPKPISEFPIKVKATFYDIDLKENNIDMDNRWLWDKAFLDTLQILNIIPSDNPYYVSNAGEKEIIFVDHPDKRKLVFEIFIIN